MTKPKEPWSVATAATYPLAGLWPLITRPSWETIVFCGALLVLAAGTAWHHWTGLTDPRGQDLDHAGMNAVYLALATFALGAGWPWMVASVLLGVVWVEFLADYENYAMLGACTWLATVVGFTAGQRWHAGGGLALMAAGFVLWNIANSTDTPAHKDLAHGLGWHNLTAFGTVLLYQAVA